MPQPPQLVVVLVATQTPLHSAGVAVGHAQARLRQMVCGDVQTLPQPPQLLASLA
jgi:hypothetical protein